MRLCNAHSTDNLWTRQDSQRIYLYPAQRSRLGGPSSACTRAPFAHAPYACRAPPAAQPRAHTVGRLANCPYFGQGREQETPEGQEEQAEPQGRERDQRRPQLPLEALGQGQE